jgi:hypothetical protein
MSLVRSFACGDGDMYYIRHGSDNFTIIDCCIAPGTSKSVLAELELRSKDKGVIRFISTHPDQDHLSGLAELDDEMGLRNFYCVANSCTKTEPTDDFDCYCSLRDDENKAFYLSKGCTRRWMNLDSEERKQAGIDILWPVTTNPEYRRALQAAKDGESPNNISCIIKYSLNSGASMIWMGDLESHFMESVRNAVSLPEIDILFAPHHGRDSGKVPAKWMEEMNPGLIVIGEAPSQHLDYYEGYDTITQNSAGDIMFECVTGKTHVYVASNSYQENFLDDEGVANDFGLYYLGTLPTL